jgi:uncharacterized protein
MTKPSIGTTGSGQLLIDIPRLLETRMLVQASSGGGKSYALRRILEQTAGHVQQVILDIEGEFPTLRERFDYVICAPRDADAIANVQTATILARRLRETRVSAIIDMYELKMHERKRFVRLFLEEFVESPKSMWHPCLVVVDEAHHFCPEKDEAESLSAVNDLITRGRKRGLCGLLATQRLSKLNKDSAAELHNKLVGLAVLDTDVKRAADDLGMTPKEATPLLRNLEPGDFYCFGPALTRTVTKIKVGSVVTTHPEAGAGASIAPPPPSEKIKALLAKLTDLPKEAEHELRTLADHKKEIAQLRRELTLSKQQQPKSPKVEIKTIEKPIVGMKAIAGIKECATEMRKAMNKIKQVHDAWAGNLNLTNQRIDELCRTLEKVGNAPISPTLPKPVIARATVAARTDAPGVGTLGKCERAILTVLATHGPCQRGRLALLAGYSWSGSFSNSLGALRTAGYIVGGNTETMQITDTGIEALGHYDPLPTGQALRDYWLNRFGKCERAILQSLFNHPEGLDKDQLCSLSGYSWSGSFSNSLGSLRTAGVIVGSNSSVMRASEDLLT